MKKKRGFTFFQELKTGTDFSRRERELKKLVRENQAVRQNAEPLLQLGMLYDQWALIAPKKHREKLQKRAEACFNQALRVGAPKWRVLNGLGIVSLHREMHKRALGLFQKVHKLHRGSASHNALGNVYRRLRHFALSKQHYEKAVRLAGHPIEKSAAEYNLSQLKKEITSYNQVDI